ncbi:MAG: hypothetical protein BroJett007_33820 [Chloroflexota bacterium]|nr:MAG: hypothetical protein BroJett007_33820 [Chloroflexota bacterium]
MTELEQFIAKLEELERTMTKGPWVSDGLKVENAHHDIAMCDPTPPHLRADEDARYNASGIAHLKNANPTIIAMLKAAIEGLKELRTHHLAGMSDPVWGAPYHKYRLRAIDQIVAHLDTLAAEALGTKGER